MFSGYKEIVYGVVFGFAAAILDTALDGRAEGQTLLAEIGSHPVMMLYRVLFVVLGFLIGWLLWRNNNREREFRQTMEQVRRFHHDYEAEAVVLHTQLQLLLTKNLQVSPEDQALLRSAYEKSRDLQTLARQRPLI
ncbi:MAG TPA: hypothetical protein VM912_22900 [Terriglobales bacterium]|nr:hypothetical protein [Terriglobales bacterium]